MDLNDSENNEDFPYQGYAFELIHDINRSLNTKKRRENFFSVCYSASGITVKLKATSEMDIFAFLNNKWLNGSWKNLVHVIVCMDFISFGQRVQCILLHVRSRKQGHKPQLTGNTNCYCSITFPEFDFEKCLDRSALFESKIQAGIFAANVKHVKVVKGFATVNSFRTVLFS